MENLWPEDIGGATHRTPLTILKEQASLLGQRTKNIVTAEVQRLAVNTLYAFNYRFYIVGPALENYHYGLFALSFDTRLYPAVLTLDTDVAAELRQEASLEFYQDKEVNPTLARSENNIQVESEEELGHVLKLIFAAQKTRQVISAILSQSLANVESV